MAEVMSLAERVTAKIDAARGPMESKAKPMNWIDLASKEPPAREWVEDHWLGSGVTLLVGPGGIGKTLVAQQMGTCYGFGKGFVDRVHSSHKVLMWACEDSHDELWRRQAKICNHYGVDMADLAGKFVLVPRLGMNNTVYATEFGHAGFTAVMGELQEQIASTKATVVILDNIGHLYGANENDRHQVTEFINGLIGACQGRQIAIILLGHPSRSQGSEFAGSGAWENAVRMRWFLGASLPGTQAAAEDEIDDSVRYLAKRKANYSAKDYRQFTFRDGVLVIDDTTETAGDAYFRKTIARNVVISAIARLGGLGEHVSKNTQARNFAPTVILNYKLHEGFSKKELADAMRDLVLERKLSEAVVGHYANRSRKYGLVVQQ